MKKLVLAALTLSVACFVHPASAAPSGCTVVPSPIAANETCAFVATGPTQVVFTTVESWIVYVYRDGVKTPLVAEGSDQAGSATATSRAGETVYVSVDSACPDESYSLCQPELPLGQVSAYNSAQ